MARDFDKEIAAAQEKLKRIRKDKEAHEAQKYVPIGKAFAEVFPNVMDCKNMTEAREFAKRVGLAVKATTGQPATAQTEQKEF